MPPIVASTRSSTDHLDGFRGILILTVLLLHIFLLTTNDFVRMGRFHGPSPWYFQTVRWFFPGLFVVGLFIVVSGYCLMLPVARSADGKVGGGVMAYMRRRAGRILPPYYAAALLSVAHAWLLRSEYHPWQSPLNPWSLISHMFVFYNFQPAWRFQINAPFWSLAPEWQLYLLFPILLIPLWRKVGMRGLLAAALLGTVGLCLLGKNVRDMHPWFLMLFVIGMLGALITESNGSRYIALRERVPWALLACVLFGGVAVEWVVLWFGDPAMFAPLPPLWNLYCVNEMALGAATCASIIHWTKVRRSQEMAEWPRVLRFLHHPKVMLLGRFSYSHYLVHYPILISTAALVVSFRLPLVETLVVSYLISIPASLGLSYLFFLAVEKRFLPEGIRG